MKDSDTNIASDRFLAELKSKEYRDAYMESFTRQNIASQIRHLRDQRSITQKELASRSGKYVSEKKISKIENACNYKTSIQDLVDLAKAFDVALVVKLVPINEFLVRTKKLDPHYYEAPSSEEILASLSKK